MKISSRLLSLGMLVMVSLVLSSCNLGVSMPSSSNSGMPSSSGQTGGGQPSGPKDGAVMAFGDGSVLIFFPNPDGVDNNGRKGFWITFNAISNYQYSLCVQAGKCTLPTDPNALNDYNNPEKENSPFQIVGPDISAVVASSSYCEWINGRIPTDKEIAIIGDGSTFGVRPEGGLNTAVFTGGQAADGGVHSLFCVMDRPQPMPRFVRNVPFYDPSQPMEDTTPKITQSVQFCQSGQGFQTFDLQLDSDQKIESVNGDGNSTCQMVSENRVVCFGNPSTNLQAEVAFNCDGAHNLSCPIGSEFDGAGCSNNMHGKPIQGMEDWEVNGDGVLMPTNGVQLPSGGVFLPKVPDLIVINGVMTAHQIWNGPQYNYIPSTPPPMSIRDALPAVRSRPVRRDSIPMRGQAVVPALLRLFLAASRGIISIAESLAVSLTSQMEITRVVQMDRCWTLSRGCAMRRVEWTPQRV